MPLFQNTGAEVVHVLDQRIEKYQIVELTAEQYNALEAGVRAVLTRVGGGLGEDEVQALIDASLGDITSLPMWARHRAGRYYPTSLWVTSAPNTGVVVQNVLYVTPMIIGKSVAFNQASLMQVSAVGTGTHTARFGVFEDTGEGYPGDLISDFGTVATNSTGKRDLALAWEPEPDLYWWGTVFQGGSVMPTIRRGSSGGVVASNILGFDTIYASGYYSLGWYEFNGVSGALPASAPGTPSTYRSQTEDAPFVLLRAA